MAGSRCRVCDHAERMGIEAAIAVSSVRNIAAQWSLSPASVQRHKARHLKPAVVRAMARREELGPEALLEKLLQYLNDAEHGIEIAKSGGDLQGLARCIKEARETAVYLGKAQGLWADKPSTIIDNRRQTLNISKLSEDELRALARSLASGSDASGRPTLLP